jgi:histidinol-phosphate aminotransferase
VIRPTPHIDALSASTPFVGPEALARARAIPADLLVRLGANESAFGPSPQVLQAIEREFTRISFYGDPELFDIREAIASKYGCSLDNVLVANGIDDVLALCIRAYIGDGGTALAASGTYPTFFYHLVGYGGRIETTPYDGTRPNLEALSRRARELQPALIYLANPDNPGGGFHGRAALERFVVDVPESTLILLDEAYAEFADPDELMPEISRPNLVRMRTFSKAYGLAGMRIGYGLADAGVVSTVEKIRQHFGVTRLSAVAALAALRDDSYMQSVVSRTVAGREAYHETARNLGMASYPSSTNFVLFECGSVERAANFVPALLERGIFVRKPGSGALASCIRVSVGTPEQRERFARELGALTAHTGNS